MIDGQKDPDELAPQVTVEQHTPPEATPTVDPADIELAGEAERISGDPTPPTAAPIEATAEFPVLSLRDITLMADPRNASSPMATDGPGVRDDHGAPEHGSGAPIPWPFSN